MARCGCLEIHWFFFSHSFPQLRPETLQMLMTVSRLGLKPTCDSSNAPPHSALRGWPNPSPPPYSLFVHTCTLDRKVFKITPEVLDMLTAVRNR